MIFTFEGLMPKHNERLHITSTVFDEPTLLKMLDHSDETISIHGYSGEDLLFTLAVRIKISEIYHKIIKNRGFTVQKSPKGIEATSSSILLIEVIMIQAFNLN